MTTVEARRRDLLPRTLASLRGAGFDSPRLFVDGTKDLLGWEKEFGLEVTVRTPPNVRTAGSWFLAAHELFIREPTAERFLIVQDDAILCRNVRQYLERCVYPERGYLNLYTFPVNQALAPRNANGGVLEGWYPSNGKGKGAVALVFSREALLVLLASAHMVGRPQDPHRGWRAVDGGIVDSMRKAGWKEYVHSPSLVQHIGDVSSMGNRPHPRAETFRGEDFDALSLLGEAMAFPLTDESGNVGAGTAAYDIYPEPLRSRLVDGWRSEKRAILEAIRGDQDRLQAAAGERERRRFRRLIADYQNRLAAVERNQPPYIADLEAFAAYQVASALQEGGGHEGCDAVLADQAPA